MINFLGFSQLPLRFFPVILMPSYVFSEEIGNTYMGKFVIHEEVILIQPLNMKFVILV